MLMPQNFWSGIGDGMQQQHCLLPHRGNLAQSSVTLPQHIQGMISHGRSIQMFRSFHNVKHGTNLSMHCFIMALEKVKREEHRVPDVVYYQIDGGPENRGVAVLGLMELVIARGLAKRVVLTRLPVGHTHEDIDSKFALIWKRVRNSFVLTPVQYEKAINEALTTSKMTCTVHDLFIIPDYVLYISPHLDDIKK